MITEELIAKIKADISYRIETYIGNAQSCVGTTLIDGLKEALDILSTLESEEHDKVLEGEVILNGHGLLVDVTRWDNGYKLKVIIKEGEYEETIKED